MSNWVELTRSGDWSPWHLFAIEDDEEGGKTLSVYHPEGCPLIIRTDATPDGPWVSYMCAVAEEISNGGTHLFFEYHGRHPACETDGLPPLGSWWKVRCRVYQAKPSDQNGPEEYDEEAEVVEVREVEEG